jgi:hypothetical protein
MQMRIDGEANLGHPERFAMGLTFHELCNYLIARAKMYQPTYFPARSAKDAGTK